jgi:hypothetical protein
LHTGNIEKAGVIPEDLEGNILMKLKLSRPHKIGVVAAIAVTILMIAAAAALQPIQTQAAQQSESGAMGIEGEIPSNPPTTAPGISVPRSGQVFSSIPITVSGICSSNYLVEIFKNNVFAGSAVCKNGSYSLQIDLFDGQNDLIARQYNALNQVSPDSGTITVRFSNLVPDSASRPTLTTAYAKRGANPGESLSWPITLSGGVAPYAMNVDWGDKSPLDLISRAAPGAFNIEHTYISSGVFNVTVKVTDANGASAFLQLVGISNGPIQQSSSSDKNGSSTIKTERVIIWWPMLVLLAIVIIAFWLGKRHQLAVIRGRLHRGERPL